VNNTITGYETVSTSAMFTRQNQANNFNLKNTSRTNQGRQTPRTLTARTRNKYRPKQSECDEMLFAKPKAADCKEWKAPWDDSPATRPLLFDSTDRAGHYSPHKIDSNSLRQSRSATGLHKRAWR